MAYPEDQGYPPAASQAPPPPSGGGGVDWGSLLSQLLPAHLIPTLLRAVVPGAGTVFDEASNVESMRADQARYIHSLLATNAPYQSTLASGANPDNGGVGWGSNHPFSIFPMAPGAPGPNLPPELQQNLAFQMPPGANRNAYLTDLGNYHAANVPQGLPPPVMTEPLARSYLLQTQAAMGGFPNYYPGGEGMGGPDLPIVGATWDPKHSMWIPHKGIPPAREKQPEEGIGPPDLGGGRNLGGVDTGPPPPVRQLRRANAGPQAGEAVAAFTDPITGETIPGGVILPNGNVRASNGRDYQFTDQGLMRAPTQAPTPPTAGTPVTAPPAPAPAPAPASGVAATPPTAAPAPSPGPAPAPAPGAATAAPPTPPAPPPASGTAPATPPAQDPDERLLFGPPPAPGTGFASPAPQSGLVAGAPVITSPPSTAPGATTQPAATGAPGAPGVESPTARERLAGKETSKPQATPDMLRDVADATANDPALRTYLMKNYGTLYPAPADILRDKDITNAAANWKAQRVKDEETFKASLKLNSTDQAQVRRALNAKQNIEQNFLTPLGFDKNGVAITPLSASPSPTGAEFARISEAGRHLEGGGAIGGGLRLLSSIAHMASPGGSGIIPGMPAEWATVEQMSQRPGVWGLAATRLLAGLSQSVLIARALGETGRVNQQELNLLQNIIIPSANDSEYRNRAKTQMLIGILDSLSKGLASGIPAAQVKDATNAAIRTGAAQFDAKGTAQILAQPQQVLPIQPGADDSQYLGQGQPGQAQAQPQPQQPRVMGR